MVGDIMSSVLASPSVRAAARRQGINIVELAKKLNRKQITLDDLNPSLSAAPAAAVDMTGYWDVDHQQYGEIRAEATSKFDRIASANLSAANSLIPQVTHHDQADMSSVEMLRAQLKQEALSQEIKLTTLAFFVKALAVTLKQFPKFNASLSPDGEELYFKEFVHIGIAVDTDYGLMVPVIRDVDKKGLFAIAKEIADLATRAKSRKIGPQEMGGGSMTISNLGGIGGTAFTPIVNPPEVAILGITRTQMTPIWDGSEFKPKPMAPLDLSYDHRVINGADAAKFVATLAKYLSDPRYLMV